jgi:hypothetical protein
MLRVAGVYVSDVAAIYRPSALSRLVITV